MKTGALLVGLLLLGVLGCEKDPPGALTWTLTRDESLQVGLGPERDLRGMLYACLFSADPFFPENKAKLEAEQQTGGDVDMSPKGAAITGTVGDQAAFVNLPAFKSYSLVVFLDDDDDNKLRQCTNDAGALLISAADPLFCLRKTPYIVSHKTHEISGVFDHRKGDAINCR